MKKCLKKICDCLVPDDVFKCLKIACVTLTMKQPEDFTQEEFKKVDKKISDTYTNYKDHKKDIKYNNIVKHYLK